MGIGGWAMPRRQSRMVLLQTKHSLHPVSGGLGVHRISYLATSALMPPPFTTWRRNASSPGFLVQVSSGNEYGRPSGLPYNAAVSRGSLSMRQSKLQADTIPAQHSENV